MIRHSWKGLLALAVTAALTGCGSAGKDTGSSVFTDKRVDYRRETDVGRQLEIPPDLTRIAGSEMSLPETTPSGSATYSDFAQKRDARRSAGIAGATDVLPNVESIEMRREGNRRWLYIAAPPDQVWFKVVDFWQQNGILLLEQDPTTGVMRTAWVENRADIKSDFITDAVRSVFDGLYSAATRDQFRVRIERGDRAGTTELFLTHFGMEQEIRTAVAGTSEQEVWANRPTDPELEAEMLRKIMVHLGATDRKAQQEAAQKAPAGQARSQLIAGGGQAQLRIDEGFANAWRAVGVTLDRVGFAVEDRDRSSGIYYVRYKDPTVEDKADKGFMSKLAFWRSDKDAEKQGRYQVRLREASTGVTTVDVLDPNGAENRSPTAVRILTLLHEQLR
jgi:outer membrane protein assembly factor BamC